MVRFLSATWNTIRRGVTLMQSGTVCGCNSHLPYANALTANSATMTHIARATKWLRNKGLRIILGLVIVACICTQIGIYSWSNGDSGRDLETDNGKMILRKRHIEQIGDSEDLTGVSSHDQRGEPVLRSYSNHHVRGTHGAETDRGGDAGTLRGKGAGRLELSILDRDGRPLAGRRQIPLNNPPDILGKHHNGDWRKSLAEVVGPSLSTVGYVRNNGSKPALVIYHQHGRTSSPSIRPTTPHVKPREEQEEAEKERHKPVTQTTGKSFPPVIGFFPEAAVLRSPQPSVGRPWPMPQTFTQRMDIRFVLDLDVFQLFSVGQNCDIILDAVQRYNRIVQSMFPSLSPTRGSDLTSNALTTLKLNVSKPCGQHPHFSMDESYEMVISRQEGAFIKSPEVWGVLRGLETFLQLVYKSKENTWCLHETLIADFPRFQHRGVLMDTSRHFLSKKSILQNLDAMAMNKLNVFHWHIVDDQSFPFDSKVFPNLTHEGAFNPSSVYSQRDIRDIINYAKLRGIRVIPEFDTPGHTESWGMGTKGLLTACGPKKLGPIDPTKNSTYDFLRSLFTEVAKVFPDAAMHYGGDECSYNCWARNKNITDFMKMNGMGTKFKELFQYYFDRLQKMTHEVKKEIMPIYWQEVFDEGAKLTRDSVIQVWKDTYRQSLRDVTTAGRRAILSSCWYLNYINYGTDWHNFYFCDPHNFIGSHNKTLRDLVIGGEACMWGEYVDDNNLLSTLWPRGIAVAERLWSSRHVTNYFEAQARFEEQRCRMIRRGVPSSPNSGPSAPCQR